jgi:hypothetical protein
VYLANVWVVQRGDGTRFLLEAATVRTREPLDGHQAFEPRVARLPDFAHAAGTEQADDFIRPEHGSGRDVHQGPRRLS